MKSSCLIIGAGGFIGFNLCLELYDKYQTVYACDSYFSENIHNRLKNRNIEIIEGGVEAFILSQAKYSEVEDIFYFAGNSVPALVETELERGCFLDQELLVMLLSSLKNMQHKVNFIYGSSGGTVYGKTANGKCDESQLCRPISAYGLSKTVQEQFIQFFAKKYDFNHYIARISNPYGRLLTHGSKNLQGFIDNAINKILENKEIEIWGDGTVVRDFIHIKDVVSALSLIVNEAVPSGIYNIGSGQPTSLNQVIDILVLLSNAVVVNKLPSRGIDIKTNYLDIAKIKSASSWQPQIQLSQGIQELFLSRKEYQFKSI